MYNYWFITFNKFEISTIFNTNYRRVTGIRNLIVAEYTYLFPSGQTLKRFKNGINISKSSHP